MSNKATFNEACDLFNNQDWNNLKTKLDVNVQCFYLNAATAPTNTRDLFIAHQTNKVQKETFNPQNQWWNANDTVVSGVGIWNDQGGPSVPVLYKFKFTNGGLIN